jgi:hypothetical protein
VRCTPANDSRFHIAYTRIQNAKHFRDPWKSTVKTVPTIVHSAVAPSITIRRIKKVPSTATNTHDTLNNHNTNRLTSCTATISEVRRTTVKKTFHSVRRGCDPTLRGIIGRARGYINLSTNLYMNIYFAILQLSGKLIYFTLKRRICSDSKLV